MFTTALRGGRPGGCRLSAGVTEPRTADAFIDRICLLLLEILRAPRGASELELAGMWVAIGVAAGGRAPLAMTLIEAGVLDLAVATLQQTSPTEWITWRTPTGILATGILFLGWTLSTLELPNKTQLLLDKGFVDVAISVMKAFELRGLSKLH